MAEEAEPTPAAESAGCLSTCGLHRHLQDLATAGLLILEIQSELASRGFFQVISVPRNSVANMLSGLSGAFIIYTTHLSIYISFSKIFYSLN